MTRGKLIICVLSLFLILSIADFVNHKNFRDGEDAVHQEANVHSSVDCPVNVLSVVLRFIGDH